MKKAWNSPKIEDYLGKVYGRLTVIGMAESRIKGIKNKKKKSYFKCLCSCGTECEIMVQRLKSGMTTSCGCFHREVIGESQKTHGKRSTKEYNVWVGMRQRCGNPNNHAYKDYGGRGITVCDRWEFSFENFLEDMGNCPKGWSLDRIDNDSGYSPENCRWSTKTEQANNKRSNVKYTYNGESKTVKEWAEEYGINKGTLRTRLYRLKMPIEQALFHKKCSKSKKSVNFGQTKLNEQEIMEIYLMDDSCKNVAKKFGVSPGTVNYIKRGLRHQQITGHGIEK